MKDKTFNRVVERTEIDKMLKTPLINKFTKRELYILVLAMRNELWSMGSELSTNEILRLNADCIAM